MPSRSESRSPASTVDDIHQDMAEFQAQVSSLVRAMTPSPPVISASGSRIAAAVAAARAATAASAQVEAAADAARAGEAAVDAAAVEEAAAAAEAADGATAARPDDLAHSRGWGAPSAYFSRSGLASQHTCPFVRQMAASVVEAHHHQPEGTRSATTSIRAQWQLRPSYRVASERLRRIPLRHWQHL